MKATRIVTLVCWSITALALLGLAAWFVISSIINIGPIGLNRSEWGRNERGWSIGFNIESLTGPFEAVGSYNIPAHDIDSVDVGWISGDIRIVPFDGDDIKIIESAQRALDDSESLHYTVSEGTLSIRFRQGRGAARMPRKNIEVQIPQQISKNLDDFSVNTTSGNVYLNGVGAKDIEIDTVSAAVELTDISANSLEVDTTSGRLILNNIRADEVELNSTSGSITLEDTVTSSRLTAGTVSGAINADGTFNNARISTVSGKVMFSSLTVPSSLRINTTSGDITISVPNEGAIPVKHSLTSGRFSSDIPVILENGNDAQFNLSSVSGSIRILAN